MARTPHDPARLEALKDAREKRRKFFDADHFARKGSAAEHDLFWNVEGWSAEQAAEAARADFQDAIWNLNWTCFYASRSDRPVVHTTQEAA